MGKAGRQRRKSSFQRQRRQACVETASDDGTILVSDTTDRDGGTMAFCAGSGRSHASLR